MKKSTFTRKGGPKKSVGFKAVEEETTPAAQERQDQEASPSTKRQQAGDTIGGSKVSVLTKEPSVGTGNAALDEIWGGGLALGRMALIIEDINSQYYRSLLSLFQGEAFATNIDLCREAQAVCLVSAHPSSWSIPKPLIFSGDEPRGPTELPDDDDDDEGEGKVVFTESPSPSTVCLFFFPLLFS